jgi:hypothetical protein
MINGAAQPLVDHGVNLSPSFLPRRRLTFKFF